MWDKIKKYTKAIGLCSSLAKREKRKEKKKPYGYYMLLTEKCFIQSVSINLKKKKHNIIFERKSKTTLLLQEKVC